MNWKYTGNLGTLAIEDADDFPGKVGMTDTREGLVSVQNLERLEPKQAVHLPLDGNMKDEFLF